MKKRNRFYLRATEQITDDYSFLKYFSPDVLDLFKSDGMEVWDKPLVIRSSPGGGKSSLLRAFSAELLAKVIKHQNSGEDYKDFFSYMKKLGVTQGNEIKIFGFVLSCARNYSILDDYGFDSGTEKRLFIALMNARILLSVLSHLASVHKIDYPDNLDLIKFNIKDMDEDIPFEFKEKNVKSKVDGKTVYTWAIHTERKIFKYLDNTIFSSNSERDVPDGTNVFFSFSLLKENNIFLNDGVLNYKYLLMFDDVQKLTKSQRKILRNTLMDIRPSLSIWLAERTEVISPEELFALGSTEGRDYNEVVNLEERWGKKPGKVKKFYSNIADRRLRYSTGPFENMSFETLLEYDLDKNNTVYEDRLEELQNKSFILFNSHKYQEWVHTTELKTKNLSSYDKLLKWKILEILITREERKKQRTLDFELSEEELNFSASGVEAAAEFLISQEYKIAYYFGFENLVKASSYNVDQFLHYSGELFENISAKYLKDSSLTLEPRRQENILKNLVKKKWEEIPKRVPNGGIIQNFIKSLADFAKQETNLPNAPYPPGVTGIGIKIEEKELLKKSLISEEDSSYRPVAELLYTCISQNLFEVKNDQRQGNHEWMVLYFNRWLCIYFDLPLGYGGWRAKNIKDLNRLVTKSDVKLILEEEWKEK